MRLEQRLIDAEVRLSSNALYERRRDRSWGASSATTEALYEN